MAMVVVALDPPAIVEQVRYRRRHVVIRARRHKPTTQQEEPGVAPFEQNVIIEQEVPTTSGPVIYIVKPFVNPDPFDARWQDMGGKKGDRLR